MQKLDVFALIDRQQETLFDLTCQIFDNPECRGKEFFASQLLIHALEEADFAVERGVGGQETAFRATWSQGEGGPNIGILGEYDALEGMGHGCGHHIQTPAAIGAAIAVRDALAGSDLPFTITVYGTPAEETYGGKILMAEQGCFRELDIALATHATGANAFVGGSSMALHSYRVIFKGKSSHAAGAPWEGRSAGDAMFLSFNGIEFLREHVKDGTRMHYSVREDMGPSNVVPNRAVGGYTIRSRDNAYLQQLDSRFRKIIQGACMMTETDAEIIPQPVFAARVRNETLAQVAKENLELLNVPIQDPLIRDSGGSTDFGNVSCNVPSALVYLPYLAAPGHSPEWIAAGKTEHARNCLMNSAKAMAGMLYDLIHDPSLIAKAKTEFDKRVKE